jgi:protein-L-isoaspartate O-methyltransferase
VGDGTIGWRKYAPFDVIVVSAASPSVPPALVDQLADGGRMLIPVGDARAQELVLVRKTGRDRVTEEVGARAECRSCRCSAASPFNRRRVNEP